MYKVWEIADIIDESGVNTITKLKKMKTVNCSRTITKNIDHYPHNHFKKHEIDGNRIVSKIPMKLFREYLIENFDIRYKRNDIKWMYREKLSI